MTLAIIPWQDFGHATRQLIATAREPSGFVILTGDRVTCCDEAVIWCENEVVIGIATIAPHGEENSGIPTIVGVYVRPDSQRRGIGVRLFVAAIERMQRRGLPTPYRVDIVSKSGKALVQKCPGTLLPLLTVSDLSGWSLT